ncbi:MAG: hypothetical protein R2770_14995 [Acidimicrobiales bacterium]
MVTRHSSDFDAYTVTPRLQVGTSTRLDAVRTGVAGEAAKLIRMRQRVLATSAAVAEQTLIALGTPPAEARWRARPPGLTSSPNPRCELPALDDLQHSPEVAVIHAAGPQALLNEEAAPLLPVPFPRAQRSKRLRSYAPEVVASAIRSARTTTIDPRKLSATQPWVTTPGVHFYLGEHYPTKGDTYQADLDPGNRLPLVYVRDGEEALILAGHHRATVALVRGEPLEALVVNGPWGPRR